MKRALFACALALAACGDVAPASIGADPVPTLAPTDLPAFFDCLRTSGAAVVSAHRGGPRPNYAENTIEAFRMTIGHAPAFIEVDVRRTRDGALVLMHDETVDRTTTGAGAVSDLTLAEIQSLGVVDARGSRADGPVPSLRQALDWAGGRAVLELDIKPGVAYEDIVREVEAAGAMHRVLFITYSVDGASRLARLAPEAMITTTIEGVRDLATLERRGVDLSRIVAWLGDGEIDQELAGALLARGVETRFGLFGRDSRFAEIASVRVQSLAVDDVEGAFRAVDEADGVEGYAALHCAIDDEGAN